MPGWEAGFTAAQGPPKGLRRGPDVGVLVLTGDLSSAGAGHRSLGRELAGQLPHNTER